MNKIIGFNVIRLLLFYLFFLISSGIAYPFTTSEEYISHTKGSRTCSTQQCHAEYLKIEGRLLHKPVVSGECSSCHKADAYPNKYGVEKDQRSTCALCHKAMEHEIQSSKSIHSPIKNGDCVSCHDPHESVWPFLLKKSYNELCSTCHKPQSLFTGGFVHKPVKDGNCGLCHDPHASNFKSRLIDVGFNLCVTCHEEMVAGMSQKYIHTPIMKSGCSGCHASHAGKNKFRLKASMEKLCFTCHEAIKNEVNQYKQKHKPAYEGKCTTCHSPHYADNKKLLLDKTDTLCYGCHEKNSIWKERRFPHGPVVQGNCTACHNPHGSDNAFILRLAFPHKFYSEYKEDKYSLCFLCHKESLVTAETAETVTNFRNGEVNLHRLHVYQKKGRTCRACHDVHASEQEGRIRDEFPFGQTKVELRFLKTDSGGTCMPACHRKRSYDRVNKVKYER
jgi:predicted CXXCH cytochrome family protein